MIERLCRILDNISIQKYDADDDLQNYLIDLVCERLKETLKGKNKSYGGNVFNPLQVNKTMTNTDMIDVRISDKISRITRGEQYGSDNDFTDLAGYLVLRNAVRRYNIIKGLNKNYFKKENK